MTLREPKFSQAYIVLGMPRTGTSLAMGLLTAMGVYIGKATRKGGNNPEYFENRTLFNFIQRKKGYTAQTVIQELQVVEKWGMKQPNIIRYWDEFKPLIRNPHFIITHRRDLDAQYQSHTAAIRIQSRKSFDKRNHDYYSSLEAIIEDHPRIDVTYEDWFKDEQQLERLAEFSGLTVTQSSRNLINPKLKHY